MQNQSIAVNPNQILPMCVSNSMNYSNCKVLFIMNSNQASQSSQNPRRDTWWNDGLSSVGNSQLEILKSHHANSSSIEGILTPYGSQTNNAVYQVYNSDTLQSLFLNGFSQGDNYTEQSIFQHEANTFSQHQQMTATEAILPLVENSANATQSDDQGRKSDYLRFTKPQVFEPNHIGVYMRPPFTYSIMIVFVMNLHRKPLCVADIYRLLMDCFPFFISASKCWRNSIRHNLSTNKWFLKTNYHRTAKKGYLWTLDDHNLDSISEEIKKQSVKDVTRIYHCLSGPDVYQQLELIKLIPTGN